MPLTKEQDAMVELWEAHTGSEFAEHDADAAIATMTARPVLLHVPVNTGATGREPLRKFYAEVFIPALPDDMELELITRTVGENRIVDEFIMHLTHSLRMDWFVPGADATGKRLAVPTVAIIAFEDGLIASEHIYWDNATVLRQLDLIDDSLPVLGGDQGARLIDPDAPANQLITGLPN